MIDAHLLCFNEVKFGFDKEPRDPDSSPHSWGQKINI